MNPAPELAETTPPDPTPPVASKHFDVRAIPLADLARMARRFTTVPESDTQQGLVVATFQASL